MGKADRNCIDCGNPCAGNGKDKPGCMWWEPIPENRYKKACELALMALERVVKLEDAQFRLASDTPGDANEWAVIVKDADAANKALKQAINTPMTRKD